MYKHTGYGIWLRSRSAFLPSALNGERRAAARTASAPAAAGSAALESRMGVKHPMRGK